MPAVGALAGDESLTAEEAAAAAADAADLQPPPVVFLAIETPSGKTVKVETTPSDCVLDVRQFLLECPESAEYTCYHLEAPFGIVSPHKATHATQLRRQTMSSSCTPTHRSVRASDWTHGCK